MLLRYNIAIDPETAQLAAAVQAALQTSAPSRPPRRRRPGPAAGSEPSTRSRQPHSQHLFCRSDECKRLVALVRTGAKFQNGKLVERPDGQALTEVSSSLTAAEDEIPPAA